MKKIVDRFIVLSVIVLSLACCNGVGRKSADAPVEDVLVKFPEMPSVPKAYTDPADIAKYMADHFWDKFFSKNMGYPTDSTRIGGVPNDDIEYAVGTFATLVENNLSVEDGQQAMKILFDLMESQKAEDTSSEVFERLAEIVSKYFYDPNSPVRSEDLYLPFVKRLSTSRYTDPKMTAAYKYDADMCSLNQVGSKASDFSFTDLNGKVRSLSTVKADHTLLFFSNPGCQSCQEIIDELESDLRIEAMVSSGSLAVVNVYIDQDVELWKDYAKTYPKAWISGYDHKYKIRNNTTYNVRAIPSLYVLDSDKRVILKDAPQNKVISYLRAL